METKADETKATESTAEEEYAARTPKDWAFTFMRVIALLATLYLFLVGLGLMGDSFKVLGGKTAGGLFKGSLNPISGLMIGILATVLLQSSSTSTSIVVGLVGSGIVQVKSAVPMIMGANIGTSVTNTLVAIGQIKDDDVFERAFAGATVHDMFNFLSVLILLPLEVLVGAFSSQGGILQMLAEAVTSNIGSTDASTFNSPLDVIVKPVVKAFISVDKNIIKALSVGVPTLASCLPGPAPAKAVTIAKVNYQICGNVTKFASATTAYNKVLSSSLIKAGAFKGTDDQIAGWVCLTISLVVLCGALYGVVKLLNIMVMGRAEKILKKALDMNDYLAMVVGMGCTVAVQSSSIVTSTLTPLVGVGVLPLGKMFAMTLGANIGTTCTALLAALVSATRAAIVIALCHLFFNIIGTIIWFPLPKMRAVPLAGARNVASLSIRFRLFPAVYIFGAFVLGPLSLLGCSALIGEGGGIAAVGVILLVALLAASGAFLFWWNKRDGADKLEAFLASRNFGSNKDYATNASEASTPSFTPRENLSPTQEAAAGSVAEMQNAL